MAFLFSNASSSWVLACFTFLNNNYPDIPSGILGFYGIFCQNILTKEDMNLSFTKM